MRSFCSDEKHTHSKRERPKMTSSWELEEVKVQTFLSLLVGMFFKASETRQHLFQETENDARVSEKAKNLRTRGLFLLSSALYPGLSDKM